MHLVVTINRCTLRIIRRRKKKKKEEKKKEKKKEKRKEKKKKKKNSVPTSQKSRSISVTNTSLLRLLTDKTGVRYKKHRKHKNTSRELECGVLPAC